jgi:plasmid maintenance system antidote protein VapI
MLITNEIEKLILYKTRYDLTWKEIAKQLEISCKQLSLIVHGRVRVSNRVYREIENLFRRKKFYAALDEDLNL